MTKHPFFPLSALQFSVLCFLVQTLETRQITYQVTGWLAGNIYGSQRPLRGMALHVAAVDLPRAAAALAPYVIVPLAGAVIVDQPTDVNVTRLRLQIQGVKVDLSSAGTDGRRPIGDPRHPIDLAKCRRMDFLGLMLYVQPLEDIIQTKTRSGEDVADLRPLL
jgi:hypothetical protein